MTDESNLVPLRDTAFARAYAEAELRRAEAVARAREKAELAELANDEHAYNPWPYREAEPTPTDWYLGTGIGRLYGLGDIPVPDKIDGWTIL